MCIYLWQMYIMRSRNVWTKEVGSKCLLAQLFPWKNYKKPSPTWESVIVHLVDEPDGVMQCPSLGGKLGHPFFNHSRL
ncbi:hypothetical protein SS1G_02753 [Sclerotinia sclerotiorum 1980 UF-70]|uniref:Uncharacterized protein n=2 Tax=Sclerotinia sclerotiorum (strain ATCC 18683 / 1980 / Ss-1) TaxID=665079 RepID=A7EBR7_SCLS1|nr:hypothetical protein SS1G_02753 [Sclerotinia sclerotiorum 1980 UF-70]APA08926.1 hypothetical protein sscle_04g036960 [Sclerotinia sclerotiorum 1980 UF-70]EDN99895.1 hypothetical protein SS1G_02753 [Sclerotinia sclerotiorum 1980 UF-70]